MIEHNELIKSSLKIIENVQNIDDIEETNYIFKLINAKIK